MDAENEADFISYYRDNIENEESYKAFWQLNREYKTEDARLERQHGTRLQSLELKMDDIGKTKTVDTTNARNVTRENYKNKADGIARQHGFAGLSYDEHLKEKEKQDNKEPVQNPEQMPTDTAKPEEQTASPLTDREKEKQEFKRKLEQIQENNKTLGKQRDR